MNWRRRSAPERRPRVPRRGQVAGSPARPARV